MQKFIITLAVLTIPLAGCVQNDVTRGLGGAAIGGLVAKATNNDIATGILAGGLFGAFCDDAGICRPSY